MALFALSVLYTGSLERPMTLEKAGRMQLHFLFPRRPFVVEVDISIIKMIILIIEIIIIMIILIITTMIVIIKMVKMSIIIIMIPSSTGCHSKNKFQREIHCVNEDKLKHVLVIFAYDHLKCLTEGPLPSHVF